MLLFLLKLEQRVEVEGLEMDRLLELELVLLLGVKTDRRAFVLLLIVQLDIRLGLLCIPKLQHELHSLIGLAKILVVKYAFLPELGLDLTLMELKVAIPCVLIDDIIHDHLVMVASEDDVLLEL